MPNEILEQIRRAEIECDERINRAVHDAEEVIRQAESDNVLKLQKAGQDIQAFLRRSAAEYEKQADKIRFAAGQKAKEEAQALETAAEARMADAVSLVLTEILGRTE